MIIYRCQDTLEGIFTGIYNVYEDKVPRKDAVLALDAEPVLFSQDREVMPDEVKTRKVAGTLLRRFGEADYESICMALSAPDEDKAQAVYRTVVQGLDGRIPKGHLLDNLRDDEVLRTFQLAKAASRENCHLTGFARFRELENGILYSEIKPKYNIIEFLMIHFADRFPQENFILYDVGRKFFGLHPAGGRWYLRTGERPELQDSAQEKQYQDLFCHFCDRIAIRERENPVLQRNLLPLHFREYMTEFATK